MMGIDTRKVAPSRGVHVALVALVDSGIDAGDWSSKVEPVVDEKCSAGGIT